jgi:Fuc2NAc and GlcNAc transferase
VLVTTMGLLLLRAAGVIDPALTVVLVLGGLSVAAVGLWDDYRSAPVALRMAAHFGAAILAICLLGKAPVLNAGQLVVDPGPIGPVLNVLAIVWVLNLFNFMDGIDGIAASEAAFICTGASILGGLLAQSALPQLAPALLLAAAALGFLCWNWPRAAVFMGDVGSGYLGYVIVVLAIHSAQTTRVNIYAWLTLGGVFFVDATLTLCRRVWRREPASGAHRTHAYQWLARRWGSHARVTTAVLAINVFWLLPAAAVAVKLPTSAPWILLAAFIPVGVLAWLSGAGRAEERSPGRS